MTPFLLAELSKVSFVWLYVLSSSINRERNQLLRNASDVDVEKSEFSSSWQFVRRGRGRVESATKALSVPLPRNLH